MTDETGGPVYDRTERLAVWAYRLAIIGCCAPVVYAASRPTGYYSRWGVLPLIVTVLAVASGPIGCLLGVAVTIGRWRGGLTRSRHAVAAIGVGLMGSIACAYDASWIDLELSHENPGRMASCVSNVKQIGLAIQMYAQDCDERLPRAESWNDAILPYSKNKYVFRCPSEADQEHPSYAMNRRLSGVETSTISTPTDVVLLFDSVPGPGLAGGRKLLPPLPRHNNGDCLGFLDGHTKWFARDRSARLVWRPVVTRPATRKGKPGSRVLPNPPTRLPHSRARSGD